MRYRISVAIPTIGRAAILMETLRELRLQTRAPDRVLVCATTPADVEGIATIAPDAEVLLTSPGLPCQRNALIRHAADADIIVFFDDDFLPDARYLAAVEQCMAKHPAVVVATGRVLADGIGGPGLSPQAGRAILAKSRIESDVVSEDFSGYGCNMAVRLAPARAHDVWFDERLPLYGWQEDVDFSRRLAAYGTVLRVRGACGVHLGVKQGRNSGLRLGYSQVANPLYLSSKRCGYPRRRAITHLGRNIAMNLARAPWPEPYVDRRGRLRGNLLALCDMVLRRMTPERVLEL